MESITVFVAGRTAGNPGPAGIGVYATKADGTVLSELSQAIGNARQDFATYYAVMAALDTLKELYCERTNTLEIVLKLDDELVKKQLNGEMEITNPGLVPMFIQFHNNQVASFPHITCTLVAAAENTKASTLAETAIISKP